MIASLIKRIRSQSAQNKGFTLIEVITSIAVLSLVSVALLEMFTVSTRTNMQANEMDKAKSICVEACEEYKANPVHPDPLDLAVGGLYLRTFSSIYGPGVTTYTKYFDRRWNSVAEAQALYKLEIVSARNEAAPIPTSYYPQTAVRELVTGNAAIIPVTSSTTIQLDLVGSNCELTIDSDVYRLAEDSIIYSDASGAFAKTALIPIHLDCSVITNNEVIIITVENSIGQLTKDGEDYEAIADIYLCDIDDSGSRDAVIAASAGVSTENKISTALQNIVKYNADIKVSTKNSGQVIAEASAEKYWVEN